MSKKDQKLTNLISSPSGEVKVLLDQLAKIKRLNNTLHHELNANLSKHCRVINLRKNTLIIAADSPIWANKLRFMQTELLSKLRNSGYLGLSSIEIKVKPS